MKTRRIVWVLLACGFSACASLPENLVATPVVKLSDVQVADLGFSGQTFLLSFDVTNPNAFPLPVRHIEYGLKLDGQRFASGKTPCEFTVPAEGSENFVISVDLDLLKTAPQLLYIVRDGARRAIRYELEGELSVDIPLLPPIRYRNGGLIRLSSD